MNCQRLTFTRDSDDAESNNMQTGKLLLTGTPTAHWQLQQHLHHARCTRVHRCAQRIINLSPRDRRSSCGLRNLGAKINPDISYIELSVSAVVVLSACTVSISMKQFAHNSKRISFRCCWTVSYSREEAHEKSFISSYI